MTTETTLIPFLATRKIDYTVTQTFLVMGADAEDAAERLSEFTEGSDWGSQASLAQRVAQLSDSMEQVEDTCDVQIQEFTDQPVAPKDKYSLIQRSLVDTAVDASLAQIQTKDLAGAMWDLLGKLQAAQHLFSGEAAALATELNAFVESHRKTLAEAEATLAAVKG